MPTDLETKRTHRTPVAVADGKIVAGRRSTSFATHDPASLLRNYLTLVRSMRNQKRAAEIVLRREDIEAIAAYLREPEESILDRLGALMGATRTQRTMMLSVFASGALLISLASSTAAGSPAPLHAGDRDGTDGLPGSPTTTVVSEAVITDPEAAVVVELPAEDPSVVSSVAEDVADADGVTSSIPESAVPSTSVPSTSVPSTSVPSTSVPSSSTPAVSVPAAAVPAASTPAAPVQPAATATPTPTTDSDQPVVSGADPAPTDPAPSDPVAVGSAEPPAAPEPVVDVGVAPVPPVTSPDTTVAPTTGGVGEPPLELPTIPVVDPSTVDVGSPPVPPTP